MISSNFNILNLRNQKKKKKVVRIGLFPAFPVLIGEKVYYFQFVNQRSIFSWFFLKKDNNETYNDHHQVHHNDSMNAMKKT